MWSLVLEMRIAFLMPFLIILVRSNSFVFGVMFIAVLLLISVPGTDFYTFTFYFGILLAKYHKVLGGYIKNISKPVAVLAGTFAALLYSSQFSFNIGNNPGDTSHLHNYLSAAGSGMFILLAIHRPGFSRFLKNTFFHFLGKVSYSFYLIHLPVLITVASVFPYRSDYSLIPLLFTCLAVSWAMSYVMYKLIELPFQQLGSMMVKRFSFLRKIKFG